MVNAGPGLSVGDGGGTVTVCVGMLRPAFRCRTTLGMDTVGSTGGEVCGGWATGALGVGAVEVAGAVGAVGAVEVVGAAEAVGAAGVG